MQDRSKNILLFVFTMFVSVIFLQSLYFKYTNSLETQYIFGTLNDWAGSYGFNGLFSSKGFFSQYLIATFELIASILLLVSYFLKKSVIHIIGALISLGVISGAIFFHLFTPLGVEVLNADGSMDGGELFYLSCGVWVSAGVLLFLRRKEILEMYHTSKFW
jgi:hypothetical protein